MSQFVNYNKRSIQLPPGCKDLSDLFKPPWLRRMKVKATAAPSVPFDLLRDDSFTEALGSIGKHVAVVFDSHAYACSLTIQSPDEQLSVSISREPDLIASRIRFIDDEAREKMIRAFFERHGLTLPKADENLAQFNVTFPNLPVWSMLSIFPVPSEAPAFSRMMGELFREYCGMNDQSELKFSLLEFNMAK